MICPKCSRKISYGQERCKKCKEPIILEGVSDISKITYTAPPCGEAGVSARYHTEGTTGINTNGKKSKLWVFISVACVTLAAVLGAFLIFFNPFGDSVSDNSKYLFTYEGNNIMAELSNYGGEKTDNQSVMQNISKLYSYNANDVDKLFDLSENEFSEEDGSNDASTEDVGSDGEILNDTPSVRVSFLKAEQKVGKVPASGSGIRVLYHDGNPVYSFGKYDGDILNIKSNEKQSPENIDLKKAAAEFLKDKKIASEEYVISEAVRLVEKTADGYSEVLKTYLTGWDKAGNLFSYELNYNYKTGKLEEKRDFNDSVKISENERKLDKVRVINYDIRNEKYVSYETGKKFWEKSDEVETKVYESSGTLSKIRSKLRPEYFENVRFIIPEEYESDDILIGRYSDSDNSAEKLFCIVMSDDEVEEGKLLEAVINTYIYRVADFELDEGIRELYRKNLLELTSGKTPNIGADKAASATRALLGYYDEEIENLDFMEEILSKSLFMLNADADMNDVRTVLEVFAGMEEYSEAETDLLEKIDSMFEKDVLTEYLFHVTGHRNLKFSVQDSDGNKHSDFVVKVYVHDENKGLFECIGENKISATKSKDSDFSYEEGKFYLIEILSADGKEEIADPVYLFIDDAFNSALVEITSTKPAKKDSKTEKSDISITSGADDKNSQSKSKNDEPGKGNSETQMKKTEPKDSKQQNTDELL